MNILRNLILLLIAVPSVMLGVINPKTAKLWQDNAAQALQDYKETRSLNAATKVAAQAAKFQDGKDTRTAAKIVADLSQIATGNRNTLAEFTAKNLHQRLKAMKKNKQYSALVYERVSKSLVPMSRDEYQEYRTRGDVPVLAGRPGVDVGGEPTAAELEDIYGEEEIAPVVPPTFAKTQEDYARMVFGQLRNGFGNHATALRDNQNEIDIIHELKVLTVPNQEKVRNDFGAIIQAIAAISKTANPPYLRHVMGTLAKDFKTLENNNATTLTRIALEYADQKEKALPKEGKTEKEGKANADKAAEQARKIAPLQARYIDIMTRARKRPVTEQVQQYEDYIAALAVIAEVYDISDDAGNELLENFNGKHISFLIPKAMTTFVNTDGAIKHYTEQIRNLKKTGGQKAEQEKTKSATEASANVVFQELILRVKTSDPAYNPANNKDAIINDLKKLTAQEQADARDAFIAIMKRIYDSNDTDVDQLERSLAMVATEWDYLENSPALSDIAVRYAKAVQGRLEKAEQEKSKADKQKAAAEKEKRAKEEYDKESKLRRESAAKNVKLITESAQDSRLKKLITDQDPFITMAFNTQSLWTQDQATIAFAEVINIIKLQKNADNLRKVMASQDIQHRLDMMSQVTEILSKITKDYSAIIIADLEKAGKATEQEKAEQEKVSKAFEQRAADDKQLRLLEKQYDAQWKIVTDRNADELTQMQAQLAAAKTLPDMFAINQDEAKIYLSKFMDDSGADDEGVEPNAPALIKWAEEQLAKTQKKITKTQADFRTKLGSRRLTSPGKESDTAGAIAHLRILERLDKKVAQAELTYFNSVIIKEYPGMSFARVQDAADEFADLSGKAQEAAKKQKEGQQAEIERQQKMAANLNAFTGAYPNQIAQIKHTWDDSNAESDPKARAVHLISLYSTMSTIADDISSTAKDAEAMANGYLIWINQSGYLGPQQFTSLSAAIDSANGQITRLTKVIKDIDAKSSGSQKKEVAETQDPAALASRLDKYIVTESIQNKWNDGNKRYVYEEILTTIDAITDPKKKRDQQAINDFVAWLNQQLYLGKKVQSIADAKSETETLLKVEIQKELASANEPATKVDADREFALFQEKIPVRGIRIAWNNGNKARAYSRISEFAQFISQFRTGKPVVSSNFVAWLNQRPYLGVKVLSIGEAQIRAEKLQGEQSGGAPEKTGAATSQDMTELESRLNKYMSIAGIKKAWQDNDKAFVYRDIIRNEEYIMTKQTSNQQLIDDFIAWLNLQPYLGEPVRALDGIKPKAQRLLDIELAKTSQAPSLFAKTFSVQLKEFAQDMSSGKEQEAYGVLNRINNSIEATKDDDKKEKLETSFVNWANSKDTPLGLIFADYDALVGHIKDKLIEGLVF